MATAAASSPVLSQQLLLHVAEELKLPLLQLARQAEHGRVSDQADLKGMQATAEAALRLIDNYMLGVRLSLQPQPLELESVSVSSVLYDAGHQLDALAKNYGVVLELDIAGRYGPVVANKQGLQSALVSLGASLIEALPALESKQLSLRLATHRSRYGIVAGAYTDTEQINAKLLQNGRKLHAVSRQPLMQATHSAGAGIFIADSILRAMQLRLKATRHQRLYGLGTVLTPNHQLQFV